MRVLPRTAKHCHRTNKVFLWPSITLHPLRLARAVIGARVWRPLPAGVASPVPASAVEMLPKAAG